MFRKTSFSVLAIVKKINSKHTSLTSTGRELEAEVVFNRIKMGLKQIYLKKPKPNK